MNNTEAKNEFAKLIVNVTTSCGLVMIPSATVRVSYYGPPGMENKVTMSGCTDESGKTEEFEMVIRRAKIGNRYVNFPRFAKCEIDVSAEGFIPMKAKDVPIFPGITVVRSFDMIRQKKYV